MIVSACGTFTSAVPGASRDETAEPTIPPDFVGQARSICLGNADAIQGLANQLEAQITSTNLVEQGTVVAILTGVLTSELEQLRSIPVAPSTSDQARAENWLSELDATVDAQVRAVSASAERNLDAFREALARAAQHWEAAGLQASQLGLRVCRPVALDGGP
jgi:hypothetical protein